MTDRTDQIKLESKIVLSVAIRLKAELFLIKSINDQTFVNQLKNHQTIQLIDKYKQMFPQKQSSIELLEKVNLMTPENIHLNSFMYEPIVDLGMDHLRKLYEDICNL